MRWAKRGLLALSTLLCLGAAYLWIISTFGTEIAHWCIIKDAQKIIRTFYVTERRMAYRWQSSPETVSTIPPGFYYSQITAGPPQADNPPYRGAMGFEYVDEYIGDETTEVASIHVVRVSMPVWLPCIIFGIAPAYWVTHLQRFPKGCCQNCGYDLRETPDRCPECGEVPGEADGTAPRG
jgi:hypothetical protein